MKKFLFVLMVVFASAWANAETAIVGDVMWSYTIGGDRASIVGARPCVGELSVPEILDGFPVTSIGSSAFSGCSGLTSVTIPSSVTSIGRSAFSGCSGLTSVTIPSSVTSIGWYAFEHCSGLTSVTIPSSVTSIGWYAFQHCSGLTSVTIPSGVTDIGWCAFQHCSGLTSVTIPSGVTGIGLFAFSGCSGLTSVTIPSSVTSIESSAFHGCSGLTTFVVDADNPNYSGINGLLCSKDGREVILGANGDVVIPSGVVRIGSSAFSGCSGLTSVTIPSSVTSIESSAFSGCSGLTSVTIPSEVQDLGSDSFRDCVSLTNVVFLGNQLDNIGAGAFKRCASLRAISIPEGPVVIGSQTFEGCSSLSSVMLPGSAVVIAPNVFENCASIKDIAVSCRFFLDDGNFFGGRMGDFDFFGAGFWYYHGYSSDGLFVEGCYLHDFDKFGYMPNYDVSIESSWPDEWPIPDNYVPLPEKGDWYVNFSVPEDYCFYDYLGYGDKVPSLEPPNWPLAQLLPQSIRSVERVTLKRCRRRVLCGFSAENYLGTHLWGWYDSANFAKGLPNFASGATFLREVIVEDGVYSIGSASFQDCNNLSKVSFSESLSEIETDAFRGCSSISELSLSSGISTLGKAAFQGCSSLRYVQVSCDVPKGLDASSLISTNVLVSFTGDYGANWEKVIPLRNAVGLYHGDLGSVEVLSCRPSENDPTILEVSYKVQSSNETVNVRALAFESGEHSFSNAVRMTSFVEGSDSALGDAVSANEVHTFAWKVADDWQTTLAKVEVDVMALEGGLLPLETVRIPAAGTNRAMVVSWNRIQSRQLVDALFWLYADSDPGLVLERGVLKCSDTGEVLMNGVALVGEEAAIRYVYSRMGYVTLEGELLEYARQATGMPLEPSGICQYACKVIDQ